MQISNLRNVLATIALAAILPLSAAKAQDTLRLTLEQALEIALSDNLSVQVADQEITRQQYARKGTYSALFPQLDFSGTYNRTLKKQVMAMEMDGETIEIAVGMTNTIQGGFSAALPLVNAQLWQSLKISGLTVENAIEAARSSRVDMIDQVRKAFYTVLLAKDSFEVLSQSYDLAVDNYSDIKQKFNQGLVSEYDMIQAEVTAKNLVPNLFSAENSINLSLWQLKCLIGIDLEREIDVIGSLKDYESGLGFDLLSTEVSLVNNPTLRQMDIQSLQLERTLKMQKAGYLPTLSLAVSYTWMSMNNTLHISDYRWTPYSFAALSLNIPIFSGGSKSSSVKQTGISIKQLELQKANTERNLRLGVKQSIDQMKTCLKQYEAANSSIAQAEKGYTIALKRYEIGDGTLVETDASRVSLTQARLNVSQAVFNYMTAKSSLEAVIGKSSIENN